MLRKDGNKTWLFFSNHFKGLTLDPLTANRYLLVQLRSPLDAFSYFQLLQRIKEIEQKRCTNLCWQRIAMPADLMSKKRDKKWFWNHAKALCVATILHKHTWIFKEEPVPKINFFVMSVRKNQCRFEWRPTRKQYFDILIEFYTLPRYKRWLSNLSLL